MKARIRRRLVAILLVLLPVTELAASVRKQGRELSGVIYFTNNTPKDKASFPVEIFTTNQEKRVATADSYDGSSFKFVGVKPGKYLLKITWPGSCVLWYRVDLRAGSINGVRVIMDLDCAHSNGKIQNLTRN